MAPKYTIAQLAESEVQFQGASGRVYTCRPLRMTGLLKVVEKVGRSQWDESPLDPENMVVFLWYSARRKDGKGYVETTDDLTARQQAERRKGEEPFPGLDDFGDEFGAGDFAPGGLGNELFLDVAGLSGIWDPEALADLRTVMRKSKETAQRTLKAQVALLTKGEIKDEEHLAVSGSVGSGQEVTG